jgi:hypothetical protein
MRQPQPSGKPPCGLGTHLPVSQASGGRQSSTEPHAVLQPVVSQVKGEQSLTVPSVATKYRRSTQAAPATHWPSTQPRFSAQSVLSVQEDLQVVEPQA